MAGLLRQSPTGEPSRQAGVVIHVRLSEVSVG
jgi:hypothetical protein